MYYNPNYRNYYLPKHSDGGQIAMSTGTGAASGAASGAAMGSMIGPWGTVIGAGVGAVAGGVGGYMKGKKSVDVQNDQLAAQKQQQEQQQYQAQVQMANNELQNSNMNMTQFSGLNRFAFGGDLDNPSNKEKMHGGLSYNSFYPRTTTDNKNYYIIPRTTESINEPNIKQFSDAYLATQDSTLVPKYGNIQGATYNDERNKLIFNADRFGDQSKFKNAFFNKLSSQDLGFEDENIAGGGEVEYAMGGRLNPLKNLKYAMGGSLTKYTGQDHSGVDGGIAVSSNGNPVATTGEQPVGLVESGEVNWRDPKSGQTYIFSKKISYTK